MEKQNRTRKNFVAFRMSDSEKEVFNQKLKESGLSCQDFMTRAVNSSSITSGEAIEQLKGLNKSMNQITILLRNIEDNVQEMNAIVRYENDNEVLKRFEPITQELETIRKETDEQWQSIRSLISPRLNRNP